MKLIWTKSNMPLSIFIREGLNEPVSHFGIVFDNGIVFHSNLLGVHVDWFKHFENSCTIVYSYDIPLSLEEEESIYRAILDKYTGDAYDFGAFAYFTYRAFLYRLFNKPLPSKNEWEKADAFLCTELAGVLPKSVLPSKVIAEDLAIVSPYQLYLQFEAYKEGK